MISREILNNQLQFTLNETNYPQLGTKIAGKVRDNYVQDNRRIIIATDRLSAFDHIITTIPFKGQVLTEMANFWFKSTKDIVRNHILDEPDPNVIVAQECTTIPLEIVVRGYITGVTTTSAWYNYQQGIRNLCGNILPDGLRKDEKLSEPIITPTTKPTDGTHDKNISPTDAINQKLVTKDLMDELTEIAFALFKKGREIAIKQGIILVDTKYEFGLQDNKIVLIDEIHTPDSSRFWFADTYQERFDKGEEQRKIDKEYLRTWLANQGFRGEGQIPTVPDEIKVETAQKYIQAYELITGQKFNAEPGDLKQRMETNLRKAGYLK